MTQRKTQTATYWQEQFKVSNQDVEFIYNQILEKNLLIHLDDIATAIIKRHCDAEELETRSELQRGKVYQPKERFAVDEKVVFPMFEFALGTVAYTREGNHPEYGTFTVIGVAFENGDATHEFVADFDHSHPLNNEDQSLANLQGLLPPEELYQHYRASIRPRVQAALDANAEFVEFHGQYFLRDLLAEFHEGLFNIADAAIDINRGPLDVDALIEQIGLAEGAKITDTLRFTVSYHMANDERFYDVGPRGKVLWYLDRLAPPEAQHPPRRLQPAETTYDPDAFDEDLQALLAEIDDEWTHPDDTRDVEDGVKQVTIVLNYPHWRVGTLPITLKTQSFFLTSDYNPVLFEFVDGRTGVSFPGWVVSEHNYVFGLDEWYKKYKLPVGAYIDIKRTNNPMQVIVDYRAIRSQRDWIRVGAVVNNALTFQMNTAALSCKYDELMIIGDSNVAEVDNLWMRIQERKLPLYNILRQLMPELSKLNPQSTVHAKTIYSAINLMLRVPPGVIFQELSMHRCFIPMRHGYWTFDPNLNDD